MGGKDPHVRPKISNQRIHSDVLGDRATRLSLGKRRTHSGPAKAFGKAVAHFSKTLKLSVPGR